MPARAVAVAIAMAVAIPAAMAVTTGEVAPSFSLSGPQGAIALDSIRARGEWTYLDFLGVVVRPGKAVVPVDERRCTQKLAAGKGLRIVAVSVDTRTADADRFLASNAANFTVAYDTSGDTPRRYAVRQCRLRC